MTPMPPACAMAIAILVSVTVSIAEAMIGMLSAIARVMRVRMSTSDGSTSDRPGLSSTSSKVNASGKGIADHGHNQLQLARHRAHAVPDRYKSVVLRGLGILARLCRSGARFWVGDGG